MAPNGDGGVSHAYTNGTKDMLFDDSPQSKVRKNSRLDDAEPFVAGGTETFHDAKARYARLIKEEDVTHWLEHGYVIIENLLPPDQLKAATQAWHTHMPSWKEYEAKPTVYRDFGGSSGRHVPGSNAAGVRYDFPYNNDILNQQAVHPFLLAFAERVAGTEELLMSFGHLIGKYAGNGHFDQALHSDYSNNTLVIPSKDKEWLDIPMIIYLTDVTMDLGPTYVVSQQFTEKRKYLYDGFREHTREEFPEMYEVEKPAIVPAGSIIIYSMRTFHRGSAMTAKEGCRIAQFTGFHTANAPWMAPMDHQHRMGSTEMDKFLSVADPWQRQLIGFPASGHAYWEDPEVLEAVAKRYPKMDMTPYREKKSNGH